MMQVREMRMTQYTTKPLSEKGTVSQKDRGSLHALNKSPRCINPSKRYTVFFFFQSCEVQQRQSGIQTDESERFLSELTQSSAHT